MLAKMFSMGFNLATLPARITWRSARALTMNNAQYARFREELQLASSEAAQEIRAVLAGVDAEMRHKAAHLSPEQKQQAAALALDAAEQHLSRAAIDLLRALWLSAHAGRELRHRADGVVIDQQR